MTGSKKMQAEGKWDKAKGEMHKKAGDVRIRQNTRPSDNSHECLEPKPPYSWGGYYYALACRRPV